MAVTITNNSKAFNNGQNLAIIFSQQKSEQLRFENHGDFLIVFDQDQIIGINVFNYQKYFLVPSGFHLVNEQIKNFLIKNFDQLNETHFENPIKVGQIKNISDHPQSPKLKILQVQFLDAELQIITNVQDLKVDHKYLFALDGAILANAMEIKNTKVINVASQGMIVSYQAIGINQEGLVDCNEYQLNQEFIF